MTYITVVVNFSPPPSISPVQENDSGGGSGKGNLSKKGALKLRGGTKLTTTVKTHVRNWKRMSACIRAFPKIANMLNDIVDDRNFL